MWYSLVFLLVPLWSLAVATSHTGSSDKAFSLVMDKTRPTEPRRDFMRDWAAVHRKWGQGVPESISPMLSLDKDAGRINVEPIGRDDIFIADIEIGNPPQVLKVALDTGSSDLWIQSMDTMYKLNLEGPWAPRYAPNASETAYLVKDAKWSVEYMDGTAANGIVYRDTVRMAGFEIENVTIQSAESVSAPFELSTEISGILGIAKSLPNNVLPPTPSFLSLLTPQLKRPVFTVDLHTDAPGRFDFGYINKSLATEKLAWMASDPNSQHWDVKFDLTAWVNGGNLTWYYQQFMATIDTGTTLMFLPDRLASMYWFAIPGIRENRTYASTYNFPCELRDDLPDLLFKLPGTEHTLTIPGRYLNYGPTTEDPSYCWGAMQSAKDLNVTIFGTTMIKAFFVAFDLEAASIGFASKRLRH